LQLQFDHVERRPHNHRHRRQTIRAYLAGDSLHDVAPRISLRKKQKKTLGKYIMEAQTATYFADAQLPAALHLPSLAELVPQ
jgi:hypothetical protein